MPTLATLALFTVSALALLLIPGPAVLYIVARSMHQGRRAGLVSAVGVQTGSLVHVAAATVGLSALLVSSATAFTVVKYAGALYLIGLGLRTLLTRGELPNAPGAEPRRLAQVYRQGVLVNVLNPKTALFFFAFLPQFVDPDRGPVAVQTLALGCCFTALGTLSDGLYAWTAGTVGGWLRGNRRYLRTQRFVVGGIYLGLGVTTALTSPNKQ